MFHSACLAVIYADNNMSGASSTSCTGGSVYTQDCNGVGFEMWAGNPAGIYNLGVKQSVETQSIAN